MATRNNYRYYGIMSNTEVHHDIQAGYFFINLGQGEFSVGSKVCVDYEPSLWSEHLMFIGCFVFLISLFAA